MAQTNATVATSVGGLPSAEQLANAIESGQAAILKDWEGRVRSELPAAETKDAFTLRNSIPDFLKSVATLLRDPSRAVLRETKSAARDHGGQRYFLQDYSLEEVLLEYTHLRHSVLDYLEAQGPIGVNERHIIIDAFDLALREATKEFVRRFSGRLLNEHAEREKLERESREKDESVLFMTHDLRNPLLAARMLVEMVKDRPQDPDMCRRFAERVLESLNRTEGMIKDILDLESMKRHGAPPAELAEHDVGESLKILMDALSPIYGQRFTLENAGEVRARFALKSVQRAVENLVLNALKYGDVTQPVRISYGRVGNEVRIAVHNSGAPISEEEQAHLFQPFHRSMLTEKTTAPGWGLGLALVKAVAEAHGGNARVRSSREEGTTFEIFLPA